MTKRPPWEERKILIESAVSYMTRAEMQYCLMRLISNIVTDTAGNFNDPYAYMSQKDWLEIEDTIMGYKNNRKQRNV